MAANNVTIPLYMNPTSQDQQAQAMQMIRAQLLAQQAAQAGQMPDDNEMAGNVVVKHSPLEYLSRSISQNMGNLATIKAAKMQMALMGQNMSGGATGGTPGISDGMNGINPQTLRQAALYDQLYGQGAGKAYLDSLQPTPDMKNAAASGVANPLDYNRQSAINTANANASVKPTTYTTPDGKTIQTTEAALAGMAGGSGGSQQPSALPPPLPSSQGQQGSIFPALNGIAANPAQIPNGAAVPPVPPAGQGTPLPPPLGQTQANGAVGPAAAFKDPIALPAQAAPQVPFSQMVQNATPNIGGGMEVQSPAQAAAALETAKAPILAKAEQEKLNATNDAADMKILQTMTSQMPQAFKRFQNMRDAADSASYGVGVNEEGDGFKQQLHNQLADSTATANATIKANAAQAVLPELGPLLQNSGIKGNKFLETIANNAVGMDLSAPPAAKKAVVDSQQQSYIAGLKAVAERLRGRGLPAPSDAEIDKMAAQNSPQSITQNQTQQTNDIPAGGQVIGTSGGKRVVKMPNGQTLLEQ